MKSRYKDLVRLGVLLLFLVLFTLGCAVDEEDSAPGKEPEVSEYSLTIQNRSQFDLYHVFVYKSGIYYKNTESLILIPLVEDASVDTIKKEGEYLVTVTRYKNNSSTNLLAYTTAFPININENCTLEYLDHQFRLSASSFQVGSSQIWDESMEVDSVEIEVLEDD